MAAAKTERLMNLLIMLLVQRGYVTKDRIRDLLYPESSDDAFDRMFERDKDELRGLGVPIETGLVDELFSDEQGYRVRPSTYALPEIDLAADEAAVIGLATRVWEHAALAEATTKAVGKLRSAGVPVDETALEIAQPRIAVEEASFDVFLAAVQQRRAVCFDYRRPGQDAPTRRHLQPWGVLRSAGRWYVVGHDVDRDAERLFRLSRVVGEAEAVGQEGAYELPPGLDVRAVGRRLAPQPVAGEVVLLVRPGTGHSLRRHAVRVEEEVTGPGGKPWDRLVLPHQPVDVDEEILAHGPDVVVIAPAELRDTVITRLRGAVA